MNGATNSEKGRRVTRKRELVLRTAQKFKALVDLSKDFFKHLKMRVKFWHPPPTGAQISLVRISVWNQVLDGNSDFPAWSEVRQKAATWSEVRQKAAAAAISRAFILLLRRIGFPY